MEKCELCGRNGVELTRHHLIPRTHHGNKRVRKMFARNDLQNNILWLCRPCHSHIHLTIDEKQLALHFNTRDRLLSHREIKRFVRWVAGKPAGFLPNTRSWRHR